MVPEHAPGLRTHRPNRIFIAAAWILGLIALIELSLAAVALLPSLITAIHSKEAFRISSSAASASPVADSSSAPIPAPPAKPLQSSPVKELMAIRPQDAPFEPANSKAPVNGSPLGIVSAKLLSGEDGSKKLLIAIKARSGESIEVPQVKVQVYFYEQDGDSGDILPSKAQVTSSWMSLPVSWQKKEEPELLQVSYLPDQTDPMPKFAGYVVAVYYKGDLQDYRSEPSKLQKQFPLKYFIGLDE